MSWLGSLAKIIGIGAAPFTGGASLALTAVGTAADVGLDYLASRKTSNAAKDAADTQAAAGEKALAAQKAYYDETKANLKPYQQIGSAALGKLGAAMHLGAGAPVNPGAGTTPPAPAAPAAPTGPNGMMSYDEWQAAGNPANMLQYWNYVQIGSQPTPATTAGAAAAKAATPTQPNINEGRKLNAPVNQAQAQSSSSYVTVQAPTGEIGHVSAADLPKALQLGAKQVQTLGKYGA